VKTSSALFAIVISVAAMAELPSPPLDKDATFGDIHGNDFYFNDLVDTWIGDGRVVRSASCVVDGQNVDCLLVPKYQKSNYCNSDPNGPEPWKNLDWDKCSVPTQNRDNNHFCLVTDEFSQVGMALAMRGPTSVISSAFDRWLNTVRKLRRADEPRLPQWNVRITVSGGAATFENIGDDDASDATARIVYALYIAAANEGFTLTRRAEYRQLADELSADFLSDFVEYSGLDMNYWLATGFQTGSRSTPIGTANPCIVPNCDPFTFAGYHGDVVIALLAAYRATGDTIYRTVAIDTVKNYLAAAQFTGTFRVPPTKFIWQVNQSGTIVPVCVQNCSGENGCNGQPAWDDADAPRAVSICKAKYYTDLTGVDLGASLTSYCNAWINKPGAFETNPYRYSSRYQFDGTPCGASSSYESNSLGSYVHFAFNLSSFQPRLGATFSGHYDSTATPPRFDTGSSNCMGAYFPAFPIVSFGTAIGRDRGAFGGPTGLVATATSASNVELQWNAVSGATSYAIERGTTISNFVEIASRPSASYMDDTAAPNTSYLYRVFSVSGTSRFGPSNIDLATTIVFTDSPLQPGIMKIKAAHLNQLRTAVSGVRTAAGLGPLPGSDVTAQTPVTATQVTTLRTALSEALQQLGLAPLVPCQSGLAAGSAVRACDIEELRSAVK